MMKGPDYFDRHNDSCCVDDVFIHESSYIDEPCQIGHGTNILHFCHIMANSVIGSHCQIGQHVTIASGVLIGNNVRVLNNAMLNSGVILENNVYCGPSTVIAPLKHMRGEAGNVSSIHPTLIKRGANIGPNTTIASGFIVGQHTFIESGSVIDRNIPDFALVYGNPIQFAGWRCECGQVLKFKKDRATCPRCEKQYARQSEEEIIQLMPGGTRHDSNLQSSSAISDIKSLY